LTIPLTEPAVSAVRIPGRPGMWSPDARASVPSSMEAATTSRIGRAGSTDSSATPIGIVSTVAASIHRIERQCTSCVTDGNSVRLARTSSARTVGTTPAGG
jgi:hypothetical protein